MNYTTNYRLRLERKKRGLLAKHLANLLNISLSAYSKMENGSREMRVSELQIIRKVLGLSWEELGQMLENEVG